MWTNWTALSKRDLWVGAVQLLIVTDDVIAQNRSRVAHADLAWLWFPNVPVSISLPKMGTSCDWKETKIVLDIISNVFSKLHESCWIVCLVSWFMHVK